MHTAEITFHFDEKNTAKIIYGSLLPELAKDIPQTTTKITINGNILTLIICAKKTPILRAAINSYSRWIETVLRVQEV